MEAENGNFDPSKILKVPIDKVEPNGYNPKMKYTPEYQDVVRSIQLNGLIQPIIVREAAGNDNYVIVDGEQRWTAAKDLGYKEIYVYNLGEVSEEEAKSLTIWMEVQVPFDKLLLAPIALELEQLNFELPFSDKEMKKFEQLVEPVDLDLVETEDERLVTLKVRCTKDQHDAILRAVHEKMDEKNVNEGRALELLVLGETTDGE